VIDEVEFVSAVRLTDAIGDRARLNERPAIELLELRRGNDMLRRVEIVEIRDQVSGGVADLSVRLGDALQDLFGNRRVITVIEGSDPEAQDVRTVLLDDVLRLGHVSEGLGHLSSGDILEEAVRDDLPERSLVVKRDGGQKGRLEPPAVLVVPLDIDIGRRAGVSA